MLFRSINKDSINAVDKWLKSVKPKDKERLMGSSIESFGERTARGFASQSSKPIESEPIKIDGLDNPEASKTNPFRNLGGKKMGEIIRGLVKPEHKGKKQRTLYLVGGNTGSGKNTVLDEHLVPQGLVPGTSEAAHVDPDFIKLGLPGYDDGIGSSRVHDESLRSAWKTAADARADGEDLVMTGAGSTRQQAIIGEARKNGDKVVAHWVHVPASEASKRVKERQSRTGRHVGSDQTSHFANSIPQMVSRVTASGEVDEFYIWDNSVEQGKPPRLIASFKDGKLDVFDQGKLDEFMNGHKLEPVAGKNGAQSSRDRKSTRLNSSHIPLSRMPSSA